jgi:pyrroline-5-carboxylate reductase
MLGSAKMLRDTGKHPVELREMVTSPGGTTIAAIRILEETGVRAAFLNAIDAARRRSAELAQGGDEDEDELVVRGGRAEGPSARGARHG